MKFDREEEERKAKHGRVDSIQDMRKWQEEATELVRQEKRERAQAKAYMQPVAVSWIDFLNKRRWRPQDVDEMPDDFVFLQWSCYQLRIKYGISERL